MARFLFCGGQELAQQLRLPAFELQCVQTTNEILALVQKEAFAFLLLDAQQPGALSLLSELKSLNLPVLILTADPFATDFYQPFVERQVFDLVDAKGLPHSLEKSLVLLQDFLAKPAVMTGRFSLSEMNQLKNKALSHLYHQLQGPVTALEGYLEILRSDQLSPQSIEQILGQLSHCVIRLRFYFHSLHLLSLVSAEAHQLKPRPFLFHQLIREFQRDFQQQMALSEVAWDYQLEAQEDLVLADPHFLLHLFSVVMNLAQRTGLEKGRLVSLQTSNLSAERLLSRSKMPLDTTQSLISFLPQTMPKQYLQVSFQFRGSGSELSRVLLAERQLEMHSINVKSEDSEIVLGVYLMEQILKASESWLYVESQPGFGLLLSFVLPLHLLPVTKV